MVPSQHLYSTSTRVEGEYFATVMTKYELNQKTFSDVNHNSSSVSDSEYAE